jgi:hypothetical protein
MPLHHPAKTLALSAMGVAALATVLAVSGCSALLPPAHEAIATSSVAEAPSQTPKSTPTPSPTSAATSTPSAPAAPPAAGDVTPPGTTLAIGQTATLPFTNTDKGEATILATVTHIDQAPQADVDALVAQLPQLQGFNVYYVWVDMTKGSGADVKFNAMYTDFDPIDASGNKTQSISIIGSDTCPSESFPDDFDTSGATISTCLAAAAPAGGAAPAGAQYSAYDSPYDSLDGQPVQWK